MTQSHESTGIKQYKEFKPKSTVSERGQQQMLEEQQKDKKKTTIQ